MRILVTNTNQPPVLVPLPLQAGREGTGFEFTLTAADDDRDTLVFRAVTPLPRGARLDPQTGEFRWTPDYAQAGLYMLQFAVHDPAGASDLVEIPRFGRQRQSMPTIQVSNHSARLGQLLQFFVHGSDPDLNTTLAFSAEELPPGANFNSSTREFRWTPGPGQGGDHVVTFSVSDGEAAARQPIVLARR